LFSFTYSLLSKQTNKQGIGKTKQQGNKKVWKQAPLNINTECKWPQCHLSKDRIANWVKKQDPTIYCLQEIHLTEKNKHWLRVKG
jgi:hypothetical protein